MAVELLSFVELDENTSIATVRETWEEPHLLLFTKKQERTSTYFRLFREWTTGGERVSDLGLRMQLMQFALAEKLSKRLDRYIGL